MLIFTKFPGGLVTMRREGRGLGDAAFAAPGGLTRVANGFYDLGPTPCGGSHNFGEEATCGEEFEVNSDLPAPVPQGQAGARQGLDPGGREPKQKAPFLRRQIFGKKRGFHLVPKDNFLAPLREPVYESAEEKLNGESDLTLKRLKSN